MVKRKRYDLFYDRNLGFLQDYFLMYKNHKEHDGGSGYSLEYNRLTQARKRIEDPIIEGLEGALLFSELIYVGKTKTRAETDMYNIIKRDEKLDNFKLYYEANEETDFDVIDKMYKLQVNVMQEIFTEKRMNRLLRAIFQLNHHDYEKILTSEEIQYYANVAALIVSEGIEQLKKYLDHSYGRLLHQDLDKVTEICNIIRNQEHTTIHDRYHRANKLDCNQL